MYKNITAAILSNADSVDMWVSNPATKKAVCRYECYKRKDGKWKIDFILDGHTFPLQELLTNTEMSRFFNSVAKSRANKKESVSVFFYKKDPMGGNAYLPFNPYMRAPRPRKSGTRSNARRISRRK